MRSYATPADMLARFGEAVMVGLTDLTRTGVVDERAAQLALEDATAEIDGYLNRFTRPFTGEVPRLLTLYCCDIARYRLATGVRQMTDEVLSRYQAAIDYLKLVAAGKASISALPESDALAQGQSVQFNAPQSKVFGRDNPY